MSEGLRGDVMSQVSSTTAQPVDCQSELASRITGIETELARIGRAIADLQARAIEPAALSRLQLDTERVSEAAAEAAVSLAGVTVGQSIPQAPFEMTPLALLSLASEHLTLIAGIDTAAAAMLNEAGIHHFADLAALDAEDVAELGLRLGDSRRISKQGWIEQAALMAAGVETAHAARIRAVEVPRPAAAPTPLAKSAEIVDLAAQRARRLGVALSRRTDMARVAGIAACAVVLGGLALVGSGIDEPVMAKLGLGNICSIAHVFSGCSLATLH